MEESLRLARQHFEAERLKQATQETKRRWSEGTEETP
jgi:hypothetical protein